MSVREEKVRGTRSMNEALVRHRSRKGKGRTRSSKNRVWSQKMRPGISSEGAGTDP
jgi:hypothetical protein